MKILMKYIEYIKRQLIFTIKFIWAYILLVFSKEKSIEDMWLISERGDEARDNGYHLFKYIRENYPNINAYYIITEDSPDLTKIKDYKNIIYYGSREHYKSFIKATHLLSTHRYGYIENGKACLPFLKILPDKKIIHLRHGVVYNDIKIKDDELSLVISSAEMEKKIIEESNANLPLIKVTGMCRYDNLIDRSNLSAQKIILIMPTFRSWLHDIHRMPNKDELFVQEDYFKFYNNLLKSNKIRNICEVYNAKIYFYPHYRIQNFLNTFDTSGENIVIAHREEYDIQDLLNRSSVLLTDYSSVFFDFAYMKKPLLYTQFDKERFQAEHYHKSSFTFEKNGFGDIVSDLAQTESGLENILNTGCEMNVKYKERVDKFFKYRDNKNCERNLNEILSIDYLQENVGYYSSIKSSKH